MPSSANKIVIWNNEHNKLFKNVCRKGPNPQLFDQLSDIVTVLESEFTFQFDKSSTYSSLFIITQPNSPTSTSPLSTAMSNGGGSGGGSGNPLLSTTTSGDGRSPSSFLSATSSASSLFSGSSDSALVQSSQQEKRKRLQTSLLFLDVWRHLLSIVESVSYTERKLIFRVIVGLMKRREFDVIHFKSSNMYPDLYNNNNNNNSSNNNNMNNNNNNPSPINNNNSSSGGTDQNNSSNNTQTQSSRSGSGHSVFLRRSKPVSITNNNNGNSNNNSSNNSSSSNNNVNNNSNSNNNNNNSNNNDSGSSTSTTSALSQLFSVFGSSSSSANAESVNDKLENQVLRQILELSYKTQEYVIKNVLGSKQHDAIYEELYQFCAQVLAINCFRLFSPRDTQFFVEALCFKSFNAKFVSAESQDIVRRNIDGDASRQISLTYTPSTESFRTLLKNKKKVMNRSISDSGVTSEENEESKHIVNRLFRCHRVFFTNELQSTRRVLTDTEKGNLIMAVQSAQTYLPRFGSSHLFFFTFFTEFVRQISRLMSTETVDYWQYAPGYKLILGHYIEIAVQNVKNYMKKDLYPEPTSNYGKSQSNWIGCSFIAMKNPMFLNVLMELVFKYTNAYHLDQVFFSLVWVESWFRELSTLQHSFQQFLLNNHRLRERYLETPDGTKHRIEIFIGELPPNFDYDFFERAMDALLSTHHFQIITRTLIFIYEVLDLFNGKERLKLINEFLLRKHFFSLFLHWSEDARACFHRILTYKVQRYSRTDFIHHSLSKPRSGNLLTLGSSSSSLHGGSHSDLSSPSPSPQPLLQESAAVEEDDRPRRTSISGPRPVLTETDHSHNHDGGRRSLDLVSRSRPLTEEISAPKSKLSLWQRVGLRRSNNTGGGDSSSSGSSSSSSNSKDKKASPQTLLDQHLSTEFQRTEESIDMVLKSKADSYIAILATYADLVSKAPDTQSAPNAQQFFGTNGVEVPTELIGYIPKALDQYRKIEKESALWKQNTTQHLMEREKKVSQNGQTVYLRRVPYPRISFPKFVLKEREDNTYEST